jgi:hypothetical protein
MPLFVSLFGVFHILKGEKELVIKELVIEEQTGSAFLFLWVSGRK